MNMPGAEAIEASTWAVDCWCDAERQPCSYHEAVLDDRDRVVEWLRGDREAP